MWENVVEPDRAQMSLWLMRIACWIPKATNTHTHTHSQYVTLLALPLQQLLHERASISRYTYISWLVSQLKFSGISYMPLEMSWF